MQNIASIATGVSQAPIVQELNRASSPAQAAQTAAAQVRTREADSVQISELARRLAQRPTSDTLRPQFVDRIIAEIESGEYDSPEKLDIALDRMINGLDAHG